MPITEPSDRLSLFDVPERRQPIPVSRRKQLLVRTERHIFHGDHVSAVIDEGAPERLGIEQREPTQPLRHEISALRTPDDASGREVASLADRLSGRQIGDGESRLPTCFRYNGKSMTVPADHPFRAVSRIAPRCDFFNEKCRPRRPQLEELHRAGLQRQSRGAATRNGAEPTQLTADAGNALAACALVDDGVFVGVQDIQHRAIQ